MEPPISQEKLATPHEFKEKDFDSAYKYAVKWIKEKKAKGTVLLMVAQLDR
jgi:hypothetical protein